MKKHKNFGGIRLIYYHFLNILMIDKLVILIIIMSITFSIIHTIFYTIFYTILFFQDHLSSNISHLGIMCITQIRNFVPEIELKRLKTSKIYNSLFENLITSLGLHSFYKIKTLNKVFLLRTYLFNLLHLPSDKILNYHELESFRSGVMNLLHSNNGYLNNEKLDENKLLNFFKSSYQKDLKGHYNEVQGFHTLIILIILLEYELYTIFYEDLYNKTIEKGFVKTILLDIKDTKRSLRKMLTIEIRVLLSKTRINLLSKIYSGFDTEFQMLSSEYNEMLAYTLCSYSKQFICIKNLEFNIIENSCKEQIIELIKILRFLNKKFDVEIDRLSEKLSNETEEIERIECKNFILFSKKENGQKEYFLTSFYDLEETGNVYSLRELVNKSLASQKERLIGLTEYHHNLLKKVRLPRVPVRKEVSLIAHFTTADVSSLADFQEFKPRFSILRKSFVTLEKSFRLEG